MTWYGTQETAARRRGVFFSFHYQDIMRVNNVRLCGQFKAGSSGGSREVQGFYDRSLWENRKTDGPEAVKNLIRDGVAYTTSMCVLVGSSTWERPWVRYEIARSVIDGKGLLAVHLNGITHHRKLRNHPSGPNPLSFMGVGRPRDSSGFYLYECDANGTWSRYGDYVRPVDLPRYLSAPSDGHVTPLAFGTRSYDYASQSGHGNIGSWIDAASTAAGH